MFTATKGQGRLIAVCSPDVLGILGPLFAPVNPQNAQSTGFNASQYGTGAMGAISGISIVVTAGFAAAKRLMVLSTAAAEIYEDRVGALQVVEPSRARRAGRVRRLLREADHGGHRHLEGHGDLMGELYDAPNQQVVRADGSGAVGRGHRRQRRPPAAPQDRARRTPRRTTDAKKGKKD